LEDYVDIRREDKENTRRRQETAERTERGQYMRKSSFVAFGLSEDGSQEMEISQEQTI
jgi:hypothetical protein